MTTGQDRRIEQEGQGMRIGRDMRKGQDRTRNPGMDKT
jgi:hypothetical protein